MRDDDDLSDYDLSAWEVPPPSKGLADAVIARATQPGAVAATENPGERPVRRWWIGVVGVSVAAALAFAVWGIQRAPKNGAGDVIATNAQLVELGDSSVQLDPGTELHWKRDEHRVTIAQPRGAASFTIHGDDTFAIDAGAMVASVEASGASLRVEVTMNVSDARVIGASALTAAVVAMVTVVVYEGRVKVASGGQLVVVEPGSRLEVKNPALEPLPVAVGGSPDVIAAKEAEIAALKRRIDELQHDRTAPPPGPPDPPSCDEVSCVLNNYAGSCCQRFKKTPRTQPPAIAACDAAASVKTGDDQFGKGLFAAALTSYEAAQLCKADMATLRKVGMAACRSNNGTKARAVIGRLPPDASLAVAKVCIQEGIDAKSVACDAEALRAKGQDHLQTGQDALALENFEDALACKPDQSLERLALMAACRAKRAESAQRHYARLPPDTTTGIVQICVRNGIALPAEASPTGTLRIMSSPSATVFIDGVKAGKTPVITTVVPGKHKVTFQIGDDKFTFAASVEAGKTQTIVKDLE